MFEYKCAKLPMKQLNLWMIVATLAVNSGGCAANNGVTKKQNIPRQERPVVKDATREELLDKYNAFASSVKSLSATVELKTTAGSKYSGLIQEYHEVKAFLLAARPASVRMVGQAPVVGKTIFDMASDGKEFHVWLPTKNKFLVGEVALERNSDKPLENLRPQHLLDALLWPEIRRAETVLLEEFNDEDSRFYVLTVLRGGYSTEIFRKIWFDRTDLNVVRLQSYGPKGLLLSDVRFSDWQPLTDSSAGTPTAAVGPRAFPRALRIDRPHDDYRLDLQVSKIDLNLNLSADRFELMQPANSDLVRVTTAPDSKPSGKDSHP
jgi:outer membrane lipoprotein-sorting protein